MRRRRTRAQALVEFALVLPVFLFLVVIAIDFGRLFYSYIQISNAAREGANYGAGAPTDTVNITGRVTAEKNAQGQRGEAAPIVTTACADPSGSTIACSLATGGGGAGNTVSVTVRVPFTFLTPLVNGFFGGGLDVTNSATAIVLGYVPGPGASQPPGCSSPSAAFTVIVSSGTTIFANPNASTPNSGVCNISGYNWTWGDGESSVGSATGDGHVYANPGTYTIILEVTNQAGSSEASRAVTVPLPAPTPTPTLAPTPTPPPGPTPTPSPSPTPTPTPVVCTTPNANFTWTTTGNGANKIYTYRDASTVANPASCPITDWLWTFTGQGGLQSNAQNPAPVNYGNNSNHPVTLQVTNASGFSTVTLNT